MADTAFKTLYREEFIAGFEQKMSLLRSTVVTESVRDGNKATFLVADTGDAEAKTRGINSLIPTRSDVLTQYECQLAEWHDKVRRTGFNIFASQGDGRRIMQEGTIKVINRKIDQDIIETLEGFTQDTGAATTASLKKVLHAQTILGNNDVDVEDEANMFAVVTPAFNAYMLQTPEYTKADYVDVKPLTGPMRRFRRFAGFNWIVHSRLPGKGTNAEKCFFYHRNAIGHAVDTKGMDVKAGENEEDAYFWARASIFMGSKKLQNTGGVLVNHDGSAFAAS
jgi:hypothetical protein